METELLQISNEAFILSFIDFTNADFFTQQSTEWLVNINISSTVRFICYNKHFHRKRGVNLIFLRQHLHCNEVNENENGFFGKCQMMTKHCFPLLSSLLIVATTVKKICSSERDILYCKKSARKSFFDGKKLLYHKIQSKLFSATPHSTTLSLSLLAPNVYPSFFSSEFIFMECSDFVFVFHSTTPYNNLANY